MRKAFNEDSDETRYWTTQMMDSPFVPPQRKYPMEIYNTESRIAAKEAAKALGGRRVLWEETLSKMMQEPGSAFPTFKELFKQMQRMTRQRGGDTKTLALQVKLPMSLGFGLESERVSFVDSVTGLISRLRVLGHHQDPSVVILKGWNTDLKHAADEFIKKFEGIEIFELGEVSALDYESKQLWPSVEISPAAQQQPGSSESLYHIVINKKPDPVWLQHRYKDIPRPETWTEENFEEYISTLVNGQVPSHLALKLYGDRGEDGHMVDTRAEQADMIRETIMNPDVLKFITPAIFNKALEVLATAGGHITKAAEIFQYAEKEGIPLDVTSYNIMIRAQLPTYNLFHARAWINKMDSQWIRPDAQTWLIFLRMVQQEDARRQIISFMYQNGYFTDVATKRGIARTNASSDAYQSFSSGKGKMTDFLQKQEERYGARWLTMRAANDIVKEYLAFNKDTPSTIVIAGLEALLQTPTWDDSTPTIALWNTILDRARKSGKQEWLLWALTQAHARKQSLNPESYDALIRFARVHKFPQALGVIFFYGVTSFNLKREARKNMHDLFGHNLSGFWGQCRPLVFTQPMNEKFAAITKNYTNTHLSTIERIIRESCRARMPTLPLHEQLKIAFDVDEEVRKEFSESDRERKERQTPSAFSLLRPIKVPMAEPDGQNSIIFMLERHINLGAEPQFVEARKRDRAAKGISTSAGQRKGQNDNEEGVFEPNLPRKKKLSHREMAMQMSKGEFRRRTMFKPA